MKSVSKIWLATLPILACLAGCNVVPTRMALQDQEPVRAAARAFTASLRTVDEASLRQTTIVDADPDTQKLAQAVFADTLTARQVQLQLGRQFDRAEDRASVVGSDAWIDQFQQAINHEAIWQAGERVRIGEAGRDGTLFLRRINGQWKVELISSLVAESGGRTRMSDPIVDYRFNVTRAVNEHFLARIQRKEFASLQGYLQAKNRFWFEYMAVASQGDDPRDKLLSSLPPLPAEPTMLAIER
jgi:hypothetical protein